MEQKADFLQNANFLANEDWTHRDCFILYLLRIVIGFLIDYKEGFR